jgi:hypothetical protein
MKDESVVGEVRGAIFGAVDIAIDDPWSVAADIIIQHVQVVAVDSVVAEAMESVF